MQTVADQGVAPAASATARTPGVYYHRVRGVVTGTKPGDRVRGLVRAADGTTQLAGVHLPRREGDGDRC